MAEVNPDPGSEPTNLVTIEADKPLPDCFGNQGAPCRNHFDVMASAAYMPAQLRAYITPEEYESAFAMSNKLNEKYWDFQNNASRAGAISMGFCGLALWLLSSEIRDKIMFYAIMLVIISVPAVCIHGYKRAFQIPQDRLGEPFKQWEKNGLKVNFSLGQRPTKHSAASPNVLRVYFPTS